MPKEKQTGRGRFDELHDAVTAAGKRRYVAERELRAACVAEREAETEFLCFLDQAGRDVVALKWGATWRRHDFGETK